MTSRSALKLWFQTQDKPTQQQFYEWLDSYWHKQDALPISSITGLQDALNSSTGGGGGSSVITLPAGTSQWLAPAGSLLEKLVFIEATTINAVIGTTEGGNELHEGTEVTGSEVIAFDKYFAVDTVIYFTNTTVNTVIKIYKR